MNYRNWMLLAEALAAVQRQLRAEHADANSWLDGAQSWPTGAAAPQQCLPAEPEHPDRWQGPSQRRYLERLLINQQELAEAERELRGAAHLLGLAEYSHG